MSLAGGPRRLLAIGALVAALVATDAVTKRWAVASLKPLGRNRVVGTGLTFEYRENTGVAFSMLRDAPARPTRPLLIAYTLVTTTVIGGLLVVSAIRGRGGRLTMIGLAGIFAGAVGNVADRIARGFVVDFVVLSARGHSWPAFNVADAAISVGLVLIALSFLVNRTPQTAPPPAV